MKKRRNKNRRDLKEGSSINRKKEIRGIQISFLRLALLLFVMGFHSHKEVRAQNMRAVLIAGTNISQINGDEVVGYKHLGVNAGLGVMSPLGINSPWSFSIETLFTQKGAREKDIYSATLTYAEIPLILSLNDQIGGMIFGAGFSYGRLLQVKESVTEKFADPYTEFSSNDLAGLLDFRLPLWKDLQFNFRFQYSLFPIRKNWNFTDMDGNTWQRNAYNNVLSFRLIWVLNGSKSKMGMRF